MTTKTHLSASLSPEAQSLLLQQQARDWLEQLPPWDNVPRLGVQLMKKQLHSVVFWPNAQGRFRGLIGRSGHANKKQRIVWRRAGNFKHLGYAPRRLGRLRNVDNMERVFLPHRFLRKSAQRFKCFLPGAIGEMVFPIADSSVDAGG